MYAIKQIKICAEYRDMLPRPRLDLSGTPGHRPIGLSPGSWQTSLGLGSISRYSAQILICIISSLGHNELVKNVLLPHYFRAKKAEKAAKSMVSYQKGGRDRFGSGVDDRGIGLGHES